MTTLFNHVLALADDALVLGHRLSEWCGHAPSHEEDLALANIALDLIGQARALYTLAAEIEGKGRSEDDLAYQRNEGEYRNLLIAELPNGDFAFTLARVFLISAFMLPYWQAMKGGKNEHLAAIAERSEKEVAYHLRHAGDWVLRLGGGTEESHKRIQAAFDSLAMWLGELFEMDDGEQRLARGGFAPDRKSLLPAFTANVDSILMEAGIEKLCPAFMQTGGRAGRHTEHLGYLLTEMQVLARRHPQAVW